VADARQLMTDITARGKLALLVGGTMLYFKALRDGLDDMPHANPEIRAEIDTQAAALGWPAMHAQLAGVDPMTAARLNPADSQRISRALEVYLISGQPLSSFQTTKSRATDADNTRAKGLRSSKDVNTLMIALEPVNRAWLHERIAQRFDAMLADGLIDEVRALRARGDLHTDLPSMRCVGYRQVWEALDVRWPMAELRERGIAATRQLAKRQITWLRSTPQRQVVACDAPDAVDQVLSLAKKFFETPT
jgi:tRNA dimethylallyltransferase